MRVLENNLDSTHLAVVSAMILGDKQLISKNIKEDYSITGASHVLALSGLHLTIMYSLLLFILSWCERVMPRVFKRGISELLILFYPLELCYFGWDVFFCCSLCSDANYLFFCNALE